MKTRDKTSEARNFEEEKYKKNEAYQLPSISPESKYSLGNKFGYYFEYRKVRESIDLFKSASIKLHNMKILDIGCHRGLWLNQLAVLKGSSKNLYGIDFIPSFIKDAKSIIPGINYEVMDVYNTDSFLQDEYFDLINLIYLLSSIPGHDLEEICTIISKKVKKKGYVLFFDFLDNFSINITKRIIKRIKYSNKSLSEELNYRRSKRFFNDCVLKQCFRDFKIIKSKKFINFLSPRLCKFLPYPFVEVMDYIVPKEYYIALLQKVK